MAFSKIILNGETLMDVTQDTVGAETLASTYTAHDASGEQITGTAQVAVLQSKTATPTESTQTITPDTGYNGLSSVQVGAVSSTYVGSEVTRRSSTDVTTSGPTVTIPDGYYSSSVESTISSAEHAQPTIAINTSTGVVTATHTQEAGYVAADTKTKNLSLTVETGKTITPTESQQLAVAANAYTTGQINVAAIPSTYVGSGITQRSLSDVTVDGPTVTVPGGYYSSDVERTISSAAHPDPSLSINSTTGVVTASHTQSAGYVTAGTTSDTLELSTQGATTITPTESEQTAVAAGKYTTGTVKVGAISSTYVGSEIVRRTSEDMVVSGSMISAPAGYYESVQTQSVNTGNLNQPTIEINSTNGRVSATSSVGTSGYITTGSTTGNTLQLTTQAAKTVTPTESSQQAVASGVYTTGTVTVAAIPSDYVGSGITRRDGDDLTASGATVSVPAGYYNIAASKTIDNANLVFNSTTNSTPDIGKTGGKLTLIADVDVRTDSTSIGGYVAGGQQSLGTAKVYLYSNASYNDSDSVSVSNNTITIPAGYYDLNVTKSVASGTAGTPTATKGTVSNHSISVTPSVTNTTGYITGGTKNGTAVSVSASELVSGTYSVTSSGTKDVTNYASASVPAGTEGTPTVTKGSVSNHSISVTPSVTNSSGFITGSTKTGTAVSVSASELVSGTRSITANGTGIDVTNYASVNVAVENTDFIVTFTKNTSTNKWEPDCTYAQLKAAYDAEKTLVGTTSLGDAVSISYQGNNSFYYGLCDLSDGMIAIQLGYTFNSQGITESERNTYYMLTSATAVPGDVTIGATFYNTSGLQTGTLVVQHYYTGSSAPSSSLGSNGDIYLQS